MNNLNPDSTILQQLDGKWQELLLLVLYKTKGANKAVKITADDMKQFAAMFPNEGGPCLLTWGHKESIDFSIVSMEAAQRLANFDATQQPKGKQ